MSGAVEARLSQAGLTLPEPVAPLAAYVPYVRTGNLVFVSGQLPAGAGGVTTGRLSAQSSDTELSEGTAAAQLCALNILAQVKACIGD